MPALNYIGDLDRRKAEAELRPIVSDMEERELKVAMFYILHGIDIYEAIDSARMFPKNHA